MVYPHVEYHGLPYPTQFESASSAPTRELDSRTSDGIHVRLLWRPIDGHVCVAVDDTKTGEVFELPVGDHESALEIFHHPFAYADRRHHAAEPSTSSPNRVVAA